MRTTCLIAFSAAACALEVKPTDPDGAEADGASDADTDTDTDTDADVDADSDTDADADVDTATAPTDTATTDDTVDAPSVVTGRWVGDCLASGATLVVSFDLELSEAGGVVDGAGQLTLPYDPMGNGTYDVALSGTFDGVAELRVEIGLDYASGVIPVNLALDGTVAGTTWTGTLVNTMYASYAAYDCTLERL